MRLSKEEMTIWQHVFMGHVAQIGHARPFSFLFILILIFKVEQNYETCHETLFYKFPLLPVPQVR